jgi:hypothetical protein
VVAFVWTAFVYAVLAVRLGRAVALEPFLSLSDPRVGPAGFFALVSHAILCTNERRRVLVLRAGIALEILRFIALSRSGIPLDALALSSGYGFFAAALADFLWHRDWRAGALAALVPIGMASAPLGLVGVVRELTPRTLDGALYAFDAALRIPFSRILGQLVAGHASVHLLSLITYAALPGAIAAGLAYEEYTYRKGIERGVGTNLLLAYTLSGTVAAVLYIICPGTGPSHIFGAGFPNHLPDSSSVSLVLSNYAPLSPRNAMPSLHFAWAVLLYRSTAGARVSIRRIAFAFVIITFVATIGSGEHYVFDLIADAPFIVALEAATAHRTIPLRRRVAPLVSGVVVYAGWMVAIRSAPVSAPFLERHAAITWMLVLLTIAVPSWFALRPIAPRWSRGEIQS